MSNYTAGMGNCQPTFDSVISYTMAFMSGLSGGNKNSGTGTYAKPALSSAYVDGPGIGGIPGAGGHVMAVNPYIAKKEKKLQGAYTEQGDFIPLEDGDTLPTGND